MGLPNDCLPDEQWADCTPLRLAIEDFRAPTPRSGAFGRMVGSYGAAEAPGLPALADPLSVPPLE